MLNPPEREQYFAGAAVKKLAKPLLSLFEDSSEKAMKSKMNSVHDAVEKAVSERDTTKMKKADIFRMVAKDQDVTVQDVKDIEEVFAYKAGGGGRENILGETVQVIRSMVTDPTELQKIAEDFGGGKLTREARQKAGKAILGTAAVTVPSTATLSYLAFSPAQEAKIKENKTSTVTNITSGTMDSAFSKASKNPTKYVFMKAGQPHFKYKGKAVPFSLATEEDDVVLDMTPRSKNASGSLQDTEVALASAIAAGDNEVKQAMIQARRNAKARLKAENINPSPEVVERLAKQEVQEMMQRQMNEAAKRQERQPLAEGSFPDLTGDGKVTQADILKGRKVFQEGGGITAKEHIGAAFSLLQDGEYTDREAVIQAARQLGKATSEEELEDLKFDIKNRFARSNENFPQETKFIPKDLKAKIDNFKLGDSTYKTFVEERENKAEGSMMMPPEGMPVDTYPNIPADEMDEVMASQLPDNEMEEDYISYVMDESLNDEEQDYLAGVLQGDPKLSDILDKVITVASEFSGAGEVDGPGTGVSDSIPARLSDGEFVFTKKATDQMGADNLQVMMDDAERAYDGGYQMKAEGGMMEDKDPMSQTQEEIEKLMMGANKMPSLQ